jgi:hypothetical protein
MTAVFCDRHIGEAHPPRCGACDSLTNEYRVLGLLTSNDAVKDSLPLRDTSGISARDPLSAPERKKRIALYRQMLAENTEYVEVEEFDAREDVDGIPLSVNVSLTREILVLDPLAFGLTTFDLEESA